MNHESFSYFLKNFGWRTREAVVAVGAHATGVASFQIDVAEFSPSLAPGVLDYPPILVVADE